MKQTFVKTSTQEPILNEIEIGECFLFGKSIYMRVLPVPSLLRSTLIKEVIDRGDYFAVNLKTGVFTIVPARISYKQLETSFTVES